METSSWQNAEDIRRDLFEYSNMDYMEDTFAAAPPKSIAEYKARTSKVKNPGLFDDIDTMDVGVFISGRGKYLVDRIITPGRPVESVPEDDFNIKKRIREVSGFGYRNEIIEQAFHKGSDGDEENHDRDLITPNLKLNSSGSGVSSPSVSGSPRQTPIYQKLDVEIMSTDDSPQTDIMPEVIRTRKKKKKFTRWSSESSSVSVEHVLNRNAPAWKPREHAVSNKNSKSIPKTTLNVNAPVWAPQQYGMNKVNSHDFPLLK